MCKFGALRWCWIALLSTLAGYWLFADTYRRWCGGKQRPEGEIRFSYWGGFDDHRMWAAVIEGFERTNPDLRARPEWLPLSGYNTKLDQQFIAGTAPDVMMFQDEPFPRYAAEQFVALDDLLQADAEMQSRLADCWPNSASSFQYRGSLRGVPIMGGNVLIYCNLRAFARAERHRGQAVLPPSTDWTLTEFVETCRRLTIDEDGDGEPEQFGFMQPHWVYYLPFVWAHGADLMDESRSRWTLQGPEALGAFTMYADLRHRWRVTPMPGEIAGQNSDTAFLSGRVAMCVNGPWFQTFLRETTLADDYCVAPIPRGPGGNATRMTWDGLCMYAKAPPRRQADAWRFVRFVLSEEAQEVFAAHQRAIPARRSCAAAYIQEGGGGDSPAAAFVAAMDTARLQPITPAWNLIHQAMSRHLTSVLLDGPARRSPAEALAALEQDPAIKQAFKEESR